MSFDDELQRSLQGLETDLYAAKMPGPAAARKRAAQRTRNTVVGTVLGGVAAVAAGAVIVLQPFMPTANEGPPARTPSPTPTESQTQEPTQGPTEAVPERIPDAAMMTAEELLDDIDDNRGWEPTDPPDPSSGTADCVPDVGVVEGLGHNRVDYEHVIEGASENAFARHEVHRAFPDTGGQRFSSWREAIESCVPTNERDDEVGWSPYYVDKSSGEGLGDESWLIRYFVENPDDEVLDRLITITLVRAGDIVSMTVRQEPQNEAHTAPDTFTTIHVTERVCAEVLNADCVDNPKFSDTDLEQYEPIGATDPDGVDPRCMTGRALCIDKTTNSLRWIVDGDVLMTLDARFGCVGTPTREGAFSVYRKSRDHVSSLYDSKMPFAMFFDGGQAVHYSSDFAAVGYDACSHGSVNVRDHDGIAALFDQVDVGDKVIVYIS